MRNVKINKQYYTNKQNKANKRINYCLLQLSVFELNRINHLLFVIGLLESEDTFSNMEICNALVLMELYVLNITCQKNPSVNLYSLATLRGLKLKHLFLDYNNLSVWCRASFLRQIQHQFVLGMTDTSPSQWPEEF